MSYESQETNEQDQQSFGIEETLNSIPVECILSFLLDKGFQLYEKVEDAEDEKVFQWYYLTEIEDWVRIVEETSGTCPGYWVICWEDSLKTWVPKFEMPDLEEAEEENKEFNPFLGK